MVQVDNGPRKEEVAPSRGDTSFAQEGLKKAGAEGPREKAALGRAESRAQRDKRGLEEHWLFGRV